MSMAVPATLTAIAVFADRCFIFLGRYLSVTVGIHPRQHRAHPVTGHLIGRKRAVTVFVLCGWLLLSKTFLM